MPRTKRTAETGQGYDDPRAASALSPDEEGEELADVQPPQPTAVGSPGELQAGHLRETIPALFISASMHQPFGQVFTDEGYKAFRQRLLEDCGSPTDPIEIMVIEQLALAHFNFGLLQCRAANARQVEATGVYAAAAARLMAEFRRSALGLQAYRAASRQLATASAQSAAFQSGDPADLEDLPEKFIVSTELESSRSDDDDERNILPMPRAAAP